mgnify:FL=1
MRDKIKNKISDIAEEINQRQEAKANPSAPVNLVMIVTIVNRAKADYYLDFIQSFEVNMQTALAAHGTERNVGSAYAEKAVLFGMTREDKVKEILEGLQEKFDTIKNGAGIAFTVPLTSLIGVSTYGFLSNLRNQPGIGGGK